MKLQHLLLFFLFFHLTVGCNKTYLEAKPDNGLIVPTTIKDLQALMDRDLFMNGNADLNTGSPNPGLLVTSGDEYYVQDNHYTNFSLLSKAVYIWDKNDPYQGRDNVPDWSLGYRTVFYANVALEGIEKISPELDEQQAWNNVKGSALFFRAYAFYQLAQIFAPPYDPSQAGDQLGIPLKLLGDINEKIERAPLKQVYEKITSDLLIAIPLLPNLPAYRARPSKVAVHSLLARLYLAIEDYDNARLYADSALQYKSELLDYNLVNTANPLVLNKEIIFTGILNIIPTNELISPSIVRVDSLLYSSYHTNDLRKTLFFRARETGRYSFSGSYEINWPFTGLATDELYMVRAECLARKGNIAPALNDLNTLLQKRFKTGTFTPLTASTAEEALNIILTERRKELLMRGLRWTDLRRLNKDPRFAKTLKRVILGETHLLPPNDNRYTWPIPPDVIGFNPSMPQNPR